MTTSTTHPRPSTPPGPSPGPGLRPYVAPRIDLVGRIGRLTAGDAAGSIDGLYGGSGGFQMSNGGDPTS